MANPIRPTFRQMMQDVVRPSLCSGCGTCVVVCPYEVLRYEEGKPLPSVLASLPDFCVVSECVECDFCALVCPRLEASPLELDRLFFGRERTAEEEEFGIYRRVLLARTLDPRVAAVGQDGGVATTILAWALEQGIIDGAVTSAVEEGNPWMTTPYVATSYEEFLKCAGSRYTYCVNPMAMLEAVKKGLSRLALVGTPCEITPLGKAKQAGIEEYVSRIVFTIGLLCTEAFTFQGLMEEKIVREMGVSLEEVVKVNIKGKILVYLRSGEVREIPLKDAKLHARPECSFCSDFSAELADISVGGLGMDGWTLVILRSKQGERLYDDVARAGFLETRPIEEFPEVRELLVKEARRQRRKSRRALASLSSGSREAPSSAG